MTGGPSPQPNTSDIPARRAGAKEQRFMKSLEELAAIRDKMKHVASTRRAAHDAKRVAVAMGTCFW